MHEEGEKSGSQDNISSQSDTAPKGPNPSSDTA